MSVLKYKNISVKVFKKTKKCKDMEIEIKNSTLKTKTFPVVVRNVGLINKEEIKNRLSNSLVHHLSRKSSKVVATCTTHIQRRV